MSLPPRLARAVLAALAGALVASCTATPGTPRDGAEPSAGASPGGSTASSPSGTALTAFPPVEVVLTPALRGDGGWKEVFRVPWGPAVQQLGVSDDHDGQAPRLGPDGGAPTGIGTWWFTDTHKLRLVEVDRTGRYLRQLPVPGPHMDATLLHVFDDGRMWASNGATGENSLWADGPDGPARRADASYPDSLVWSGDDGAAAYARGNDGRSYRLAVTPDGPQVTPTDWWRTRDGRRFLPRLDLYARRAFVDLPDAPAPATVELRFTYPGDPTKLLIFAETRAGTDGRVHLLVAGVLDGPEPIELATLVTVEADGRVGKPVPVPFFQTGTDMGSPSHLQIQPDSGHPALVVNREDHTAVLTPPVSPRPTATADTA